VINLSTIVISVFFPLLFDEEITVLKSHLIRSKNNKLLVQEYPIMVKFPQNTGRKMPTAQRERKLHCPEVSELCS
jgi:hypothetical protein